MAEVLKLHARFAYRRKLTVRDVDTGLLVDLVGKSIFLETEGGAFRKELLSGPDTKTRILLLTPADIAQLPTSSTDFVIIDETVDGIPQDLGDGKLKRVGWSKP